MTMTLPRPGRFRSAYLQTPIFCASSRREVEYPPAWEAQRPRILTPARPLLLPQGEYLLSAIPRDSPPYTFSVPPLGTSPSDALWILLGLWKKPKCFFHSPLDGANSAPPTGSTGPATSERGG